MDCADSDAGLYRIQDPKCAMFQLGFQLWYFWSCVQDTTSTWVRTPAICKNTIRWSVQGGIVNPRCSILSLVVLR